MMKIKTILTGGAALLLLSAAWKNRDSEWVRSFTAPTRTQTQPSIRFDNDAPDNTDRRTAEPAGTSARQRLSGVRKCRRGEQVIYTDAECPAGSREHVMNGGAVTVVPGPRTLPAPQLPDSTSLPTARLPHARELLLSDDGQGRLRGQAMERAIDR